MGKRSNFKRMKGDFYETPKEAFANFPIKYIAPRISEPCAGNGAIVDILNSYGRLVSHKSDIDPKRSDIEQADVFDLTFEDIDVVITNPPWSRDILHPMIEHLANHVETYLLFDADWMHTKQASHLLETFCTHIYSVGRLKWISDSPYVGKDNAAWYRFVPGKRSHAINFVPRGWFG